MKTVFLLIASFVLVLFAELPTYNTSSLIEANGEPIVVDVGMASPCVTDWNLDGKKDLIVGQYGDGKIRYYENIGSNDNPIFGDFIFMEADGEDISLEAN